MNKKSYLSFTLLAGCLVAASVPAAEQVNLGAGVRSGVLFSIGYTKHQDLYMTEALQALGVSDIGGGDTDTKLGFSLGYRKALGSHWSIDGQYIHQNMNTTPLTGAVSTGVTTQTVQQISTILPKQAQGVTMIGLYHAPLSARSQLNYGAGVFVWRGERETRLGNTIASHKTSGIDPVLQLGLTYNLTPRVALQGDVQRLFLPGDAVNRLSLGVVYSFH